MASWLAARFVLVLCLVLVLCVVPGAAPALAQDVAGLEGRVVDGSGAALPGAAITVRAPSIRVELAARSDAAGYYRLVGLAAGVYQVVVEAAGFRGETIDALHVDVGRVVVRDFRLAVGDRHEVVVVRAEVPLVDRATATVGHVVDERTVQQIPLNGRHFIELGMLVPGSVAPSQTGF